MDSLEGISIGDWILVHKEWETNHGHKGIIDGWMIVTNVSTMKKAVLARQHTGRKTGAMPHHVLDHCPMGYNDK